MWGGCVFVRIHDDAPRLLCVVTGKRNKERAQVTGAQVQPTAFEIDDW